MRLRCHSSRLDSVGKVDLRTNWSEQDRIDLGVLHGTDEFSNVCDFVPLAVFDQAVDHTDHGNRMDETGRTHLCSRGASEHKLDDVLGCFDTARGDDWDRDRPRTLINHA